MGEALVVPWSLLTGADGRPASTADRAAGATFRLHKGPPPFGPGSWKLIARSLSAPMEHRATALFAGWLPRGFISTEPLKDTIRRVAPTGWADHPNLWVVACDYATGRRVAFGREDAPDADLAEAVAASCAIPGFYHPVTIDGRRYVDGGLWSTSNLDILRNDQERAPALDHCLEDRQHCLQSRQLLLVDQEVRVLQLGDHLLGVGNEIRR